MKYCLSFITIICVAVTGYLLLKQDGPSPVPPSSTEPSLPKARPVQDPAATAMDTVLDEKADFRKRLTAVRNLPKDLSKEDQQRLRQLAKTKKLDSTIFNDTLAALERQHDKLPCLGRDLIEVWHRDKGSNTVTADYVIQHLETVFDYSDNQPAIEDLLLRTAAMPGESDTYRGTAMMSLLRLSERQPHLTSVVKRVANEAIEKRGKGEDAQEVQVTALQVAMQAGDKSVLDRARKLAVDHSVIVRLRMSAIGVVGSMGSPADLKILSACAESQNKRIRRAATYQIRQLKKRFKIES